MGHRGVSNRPLMTMIHVAIVLIRFETPSTVITGHLADNIYLFFPIFIVFSTTMSAYKGANTQLEFLVVLYFRLSDITYTHRVFVDTAQIVYVRGVHTKPRLILDLFIKGLKIVKSVLVILDLVVKIFKISPVKLTQLCFY